MECLKRGRAPRGVEECLKRGRASNGGECSGVPWKWMSVSVVGEHRVEWSVWKAPKSQHNIPHHILLHRIPTCSPTLSGSRQCCEGEDSRIPAPPA